MTPRLSGLGMVLVAGAIAVCGIMMVGGVGPAAGGRALTGDPVPGVAPRGDDQPPETTMTTTTTTATSTTSTVPPVTAAVVTATTTPVAPVPLTVSSSGSTAGAGGVVTFEGTCPVVDGVPLGPVVLWLIARDTDVLTTGMVAETWSYAWTAPTDVDEFSSFTFQFWCGDPTGYDGGYPADLQLVVDMVAQEPPAVIGAESEPPAAIPETN